MDLNWCIICDNRVDDVLVSESDNDLTKYLCLLE